MIIKRIIGAIIIFAFFISLIIAFFKNTNKNERIEILKGFLLLTIFAISFAFGLWCLFS